MAIKVAKIVGTADAQTWSQVHEFEPQDEKLNSHGQLMATLAFEVKKEDLQVSSFGTEIITRLQEIYYSNESESVIKKIEQTIESLQAEFFNEVSLEMVLMVMLEVSGERVLYAGKNGGGRVVLLRGEQMVSLLEKEGMETKVVSGKLVMGDKLVGGTKEFFELVADGVLRSAFSKDYVEQVVENLAPVVHGHENNSQTAAVVVKVLGGGQPARVVVEDEKKEDPAFAGQGSQKVSTNDIHHSVVGRSREKVKRFWKLLRSWLTKLQPKAVRVRDRDPKKQKSAATMAVVLILVFGVSLVLAGRKRSQSKKADEYQQVMEEVSYKYDEAMGLLELNPLRAKSLLSDSKAKIDEYKASNEKANGDLDELSKKIEEALGEAQREYAVEDASEWFDFSLVKTGFKASDWESEEGTIMVWDEQTKTVVEVVLATKSSKVVVGGDKVTEGSLVGLAGERGFVVGDDLVTVVDSEDEEVVAEIGEPSWNKIVDAVGFSSNLYLLDGSSEGQIHKYLGVNSGLSAQREYLNGETYDMSEAVSMAIDGSVWVLFTDGTIAKYVRGVKDPFTIVGLDEEFLKPVKLFTSGEVENLYILDHQKTRVVVIDKSGEYQAQYRWPGIAGVKDLVVSEELGKIFLLTTEKIFTIELSPASAG